MANLAYEQSVKRFNGRSLAEMELSDKEAVDVYRRLHGIPEEISSSGIILLEGKPVVLVAELKRVFDVMGGGSIEIVETKTMKCVEAGCVDRIFKGWKKTSSGKAYKDWEEKGPSKSSVMWIVRVKITRDDGKMFVEEGDCCPHNCTSLTRTAMKRMAQTRAIGRALRLATSMSMTTYEELDVKPAVMSTPSPVPKKKSELPKPKKTEKEDEELAFRKKLYRKSGAATTKLAKAGVDKNKARKIYYLVLQKDFNVQSAKDLSLDNLKRFVDIYAKECETITAENVDDRIKEMELDISQPDVVEEDEFGGEIQLD